MELGFLLGALALGAILFGAGLTAVRVHRLAKRHSLWTITVHFTTQPTIENETVNRAMASAFPGTTFATRQQQRMQWTVSGPDGEYVVKLSDSFFDELATKAKFRLTLSVLAKEPPTTEQHRATFANLCRVAAAFARKGGAFVSSRLAFGDSSDGVTRKVEPLLLEQLAAGHADGFPPKEY